MSLSSVKNARYWILGINASKEQLIRTLSATASTDKKERA